MTNTRLPAIVAVASVVVAVEGAVAIGIVASDPPPGGPPPLHPAKSVEASIVKASDLFFMLEECDAGVKEF